MSDDRAAWFGGLGTTSRQGNRNYFTPGAYTVKLESMKRQIGKRKVGHKLVIAEFSILEVVQADEGERSPDGSWLFRPSNEAGARVSVVIDLDWRDSSPMEKLKDLLCGITGMEENDGEDSDWIDLAWDLTDPAQSWNERIDAYASGDEGVVMHAIVNRSFSSKSNTPLALVNFFHPDDA